MNETASAPEPVAVAVRAATLQDSERIAVLSGQLGYPASPQDVERRLKLIEHSPGHVVLAAETPNGLVIGWVHGYVRRILESEPTVEIGGLVVDENYRGCGAGRMLMEHIETWARESGCAAVTLRSNVIRDGAHKFYRSMGYTIRKSQHAFWKKL